MLFLCLCRRMLIQRRHAPGSVSSIPYIVTLESLLLFFGSLSSVSFGHVILYLFAAVEAVHRSVDEHSTCPRSSTLCIDTPLSVPLCTNLSQPSCYSSRPQWPSPPYYAMKKFRSSSYLRLTTLPFNQRTLPLMCCPLLFGGRLGNHRMHIGI